MMTPSSRNAVFLDVDGDGPADFANDNRNRQQEGREGDEMKK